MSQRFQIEDLVAQDEHGVVFRAQDSETGREVAVRRIFPYGPDGGGLKEDQQAAYEAGIQKFGSIQHAGLRKVISGGCDPVDGMPFLATEWLEGPTLAKAMESGPIPAASVIALMQRALDLCTTLSIAFNEEETVWLETSPSAIIVGEDDPERGFTFWVAPLKWLNEAGGKRGLAPLAKLTRLKALYLNWTPIGDAGLAHIRGLPQLNEVHLQGTQITDAALDHLASLPALKTAWVAHTAVTEAGAERFRQRRPDVTLFR